MNVLLWLAYKGTNYAGFQVQPNAPTVCSTLQDAMQAVLGCRPDVKGCSRTDAGVHALGQAAHFETISRIPPEKYAYALNTMLPADIRIRKSEAVGDDFHARFSAKGRGYIYRILNRRARTVLLENRVWHVGFPLDVDLMRQGAKHLLGHHDFSAFRGAGCQALSPIKTLDKLDIVVNGDEIDFIVEARSFLYHQVRNMVGTLKMVGDKHLTPNDVKTILEGKCRAQAGVTAPACGLYLSKIVY